MKAVIPAAGLGTRFLPATKAQPKEMLPVVDKPTIQYVVEEAALSGIDDILIITGRGKRAIEDHFDRAFELEYYLDSRGARDSLEDVKSIADLADIHYVRQKEPKGLGHAILCAKKHVGDEPFAVLLGDIIALDGTPATQQILNVFERFVSSCIGVTPVAEELVERYGIVSGVPVEDGIMKIDDLVEKPRRAEAPSNLAIFGRYVLTPEIFDCLEQTEPDAGGEIQLTDALRLLLERQPIYACDVTGEKHDTGSKLDWLIANIDLALRRDDLADDLKAYLRELKLD